MSENIEILPSFEREAIKDLFLLLYKKGVTTKEEVNALYCKDEGCIHKYINIKEDNSSQN